MGQGNDLVGSATEHRFHPSDHSRAWENGPHHYCRFPGSPKAETPRSTAGSPALATLQPPDRADLLPLGQAFHRDDASRITQEAVKRPFAEGQGDSRERLTPISSTAGRPVYAVPSVRFDSLRRFFMPIRIRRHDKNNVHPQVLDTIMFMTEKL